MDETRRSTIVQAGAGQPPTAAAVVRAMYGVPWSRARTLCERGKVWVDGQPCIHSATRLAPGSEVTVEPRAGTMPAAALAPDAVLYLDRDIVVVRKPAGVMTVPFSAGDHNTLVDRLARALKRRTGRRSELGVVQRLDKDTTGLLLFARTLAAKRHLQQQFRRHSVERQYLALVHGTLDAGMRIDSHLLRDRGDGLRGSYGHFRRPHGSVPAGAQRALTEVLPIAATATASLVRCRLHTGRQHQIRIHLSEQGHPLIGERVYIRDYRGPILPAARPMLHAAVLHVDHPRSGRRLQFEEPPPEDFAALWQTLAPTAQ